MYNINSNVREGESISAKLQTLVKSSHNLMPSAAGTIHDSFINVDLTT